jgi:uncharacterized protein YodC (DUF2158 family)
MSAMTLKKGDTVKLKSGGPVMTVQGESMGGEVICKWFVEEQMMSATFVEEALEPANPMMQPKR